MTIKLGVQQSPLNSVRGCARTADLAAIHAARRGLALTEESYRAILQRVTGKGSAADLTADERGRVIEEFRRLGFKPRAGRSFALPQARMARGLWIELANQGVVRNRTDKGLDAFVRRQTGIDAARWLTDPGEAGKVIEALKAMRDRARRGDHGDGD